MHGIKLGLRITASFDCYVVDKQNGPPVAVVSLVSTTQGTNSSQHS